MRYRLDLVGNVKALKEQRGKNILCIGSPSLRVQRSCSAVLGQRSTAPPSSTTASSGSSTSSTVLQPDVERAARIRVILR